jgi:hypothetical protein
MYVIKCIKEINVGAYKTGRVFYYITHALRGSLLQRGILHVSFIDPCTFVRGLRRRGFDSTYQRRRELDPSSISAGNNSKWGRSKIELSSPMLMAKMQEFASRSIISWKMGNGNKYVSSRLIGCGFPRQHFYVSSRLIHNLEDGEIHNPQRCSGHYQHFSVSKNGTTRKPTALLLVAHLDIERSLVHDMIQKILLCIA